MTTRGIVTIFSLIAFGLSIFIFFFDLKKWDKKGPFLGHVKDKKLSYIASLLFFVASISLFLLERTFIDERWVSYVQIALEKNPSDAIFGLIIMALISVPIWLFLTTFYANFYVNKRREKEKALRITMIISLVLIIAWFYFASFVFGPYIRYPLCNRIYIGSSGIKLITDGNGYLWSPKPEGDKFGFEIALYGIVILFGAFLCLLYVNYKLEEITGESSMMTNIFIVALPFGILGARLWYVVGEWTYFSQHPDRIFAIQDGGLTIMGASLGIVAGVVFLLILKYAIKKQPYNRVSILKIVDFTLPTILIAQAVGRFGNFFNNEVHGQLVNLSSYMWLPQIIVNNMHFSSAHVVYSLAEAFERLNSSTIYCPLFAIEGLTNIAGALLIEYGFGSLFRKLAKRDDKWYNKALTFIMQDGSNLGYYFIWYGFTRVIMEPLRDSQFNMGDTGNWSYYNAYVMAGIGLLCVIIFGIVGTILNKKERILRRTKVLIFDLDGTTADTDDAIAATYKLMLEYLDSPRKDMSEEEMHKFSGPAITYAFNELFPTYSFDYLLEQAVINSKKVFPKLTKEFENEREVLEKLKAAGYKIVLATNKNREMTDFTLKQFGYEDMFEFVITAQETINKKPLPENIYTICQFMNVDFKECLCIGDSFIDFDNAVNAETNCILMTMKERKYDHKVCPLCFVKNFNELYEVLKDHGN